MLTKGMIMLICGGLGLIGTIIWILVDIINKDKREKARIRMATKELKAVQEEETMILSSSFGDESTTDLYEGSLPETEGLIIDDKTEMLYIGDGTEVLITDDETEVL